MARGALIVGRGALALAMLLVGRTVFGLTYLLGAIGRWPTLWYAPLARTFSWGEAPPGIGMEWFGRTATAAFAGIAAMLIVWICLRSRVSDDAMARTRGGRFVSRAAPAAALALVIDFTTMGWAMVRQPIAAPPNSMEGGLRCGAGTAPHRSP